MNLHEGPQSAVEHKLDYQRQKLMKRSGCSTDLRLYKSVPLVISSARASEQLQRSRAYPWWWMERKMSEQLEAGVCEVRIRLRTPLATRLAGSAPRLLPLRLRAAFPLVVLSTCVCVLAP